MAYEYHTEYNAPGYTPNGQVAGAYGIGPRTIEGITIHWWGDPNQNPRFDNIVGYLCRPGANTSAHFVATGDDNGRRRVACLVSPLDAAWHAGSAWGNVHTIGIELDPRARDVDYDVAAELIADIRSAYGDVPIYWHSYFSATACPGHWDANRLDALSYTKFSHETAWGQGGNKVQTPAPTPTPAPEPVKPAPVTRVSVETFSVPKQFKVKDATFLVNFSDNSRYGTTSYTVGSTINDVVEKQVWSNGGVYYRTKYARDNAKKDYGFIASYLVEVVPEVPAPVVTVPSPTTQDPVTGQPLPDTGKDITEKDDWKEWLEEVRKNSSLITKLIELLKSIFKIGA